MDYAQIPFRDFFWLFIFCAILSLETLADGSLKWRRAKPTCEVKRTAAYFSDVT